VPEHQHKESRHAPRVDFEVEVTFESEHNFYTGFTHNISSGGLFIACHDPSPVGSTVRVKFALPGLPGPVEAETIVRWVREVGELNQHGMGVQFSHLPPPVQEAIDKFIQQRDSIFYDHD
jgi:uncharacterized protein (TIGR02266 family)